MSDSSRPFSQDDPYPDENLLEGLQRLAPTAHYHTEVARGSETEGSLLLDSINSYIHNSDTVIVAIQEAAEDEQEPPPPLQLPSLPLEPDPSALVMDMAGSRSVRNSSQPLSAESPEPAEQGEAVLGFIQPVAEGVQSTFSLGFSHYNSRNQESLSKTDLNSSLLVEISNHKPTETNFYDHRPSENVPETLPNTLVNEGFVIATYSAVPANDQRDQPIISPITYYQKQLSNLAPPEEAMPGEDVSNDSIDSSKLAALLPLDCLPSERCTLTERIEQTEYQNQTSQSALKNCEEAIEFMEIEPMKRVEAEIPMDIEFIQQKPELIPMDIEAICPGYQQIPMDIESVGFTYCSNLAPQYLNAITLDPIQPDSNHPLVEQQQAQEQEMIDSMSLPRANPQPEQYNEFTFGKEEVEYTLYDQMKEEHLKDKEKEIIVDPDENNQSSSKLVQLEAFVSADPAQESSFWNELREENIQSLSMNVEHDNNFSNTMREADDIFGIPSKKDEDSINVNQNEPILVNLLVESIDQREEHVPPSRLKADSSFEYQAISVNEDESKIMGNNNNYNTQPDTVVLIHQGQNHECSNNFIAFREESLIIEEDNPLEMMMIESVPQKNQELHLNKNNSSPQKDIADIYYSEPQIIVLQPRQEEIKIQKFNRCTFESNVWNFILQSECSNDPQLPNKPSVLVEQQNPQYSNIQNSHEAEESQPIVNPQVMVHPSPMPQTSTQDQNYLYFQQNPQIVYQPIISVPVQPWMTISYKMNEASINIFGPATSNRQESSSNATVPNNVTVPNNELTSIFNQHPQEERASPPNIQNGQQTMIIQHGSRLKTQQHQECLSQKSVSVQIPKKQYTNSAIQTADFVQVIEPQRQQAEVLIEDISETCDYIMRQSEKYLLFFAYTNEKAHKDFEKLVNQYVLLRFTPEPKTQIGNILFKNGLFLIAIVKLITRSSPSPFIISYIYEFLENTYEQGLDRNKFVFKAECQKAKANYQSVLENKYNEFFVSKMEQNKEKKSIGQPIKRNCITKNLFYSIHGQRVDKQEIGFQTQPQRSKTPPERHERPSAKKESYREAQAVISVKPKQVTQSKKAPIIVDENLSTNRTSVPQVIQSAKADVKENSAQKSINKQKPEMIEPSGSKLIQRQVKKEQQNKDVSNKKDKTAEIKKNIEEIKNSFGSYGKKGESTPGDSNTQLPKIQDLYAKYQKIANKRQSIGSDLPIDNSSIKKNLISQVTKEQKQREPEKKPNKKHVAFPEQIKQNTEFEDDTDEENLKKKKLKRRTKSKKDASVESSEQEEPEPMKTRKAQSKKEK